MQKEGIKKIMIGVVLYDCDYTIYIDEKGFAFRSWNVEGTCCSALFNQRNYGYAQYLKDSDIVDVILDLEKGKLSFVINEKNCGVAIDDVPLNKLYRFGVSLGNKDSQGTLL